MTYSHAERLTRPADPTDPERGDDHDQPRHQLGLTHGEQAGPAGTVSEYLARLLGQRPDSRNNHLLIDYIRDAERLHRVPSRERLPLQPRERT